MLKPEQTLIIASHNAGKVVEISTLLAPWRIRVQSSSSLGLEEPEENGASFIDNALIKARSAFKASGQATLADDSGLEVLALNREPGIYSARWAGESRDFSRAMEKVHDRLRHHDDKRARFVCALALCTPDGSMPDGQEKTFLGTCSGTLVWPPRGTFGFGYDPMFVADGHQQTFGEMSPSEKHRLSHRMDAFRKFSKACLPPRQPRFDP